MLTTAGSEDGTSLTGCPDDHLLERFRTSGDPLVFAELYRRHWKSVHQSCYRMLQSDADAAEITQETFTAVFQRNQRYRGGSFRAWVFTIARNRCLNLMASARWRYERVNGADPPAPAESAADATEQVEAVLTVLSQLSAPQRVCLKYHYIEGFTYEEIAKELGISVGAVKSHIQNGRNRFAGTWNRQLAGGKRGPS